MKIEQSKHVVFPVEKEKCYLTIFGSDNSRLIPGQIYIYIRNTFMCRYYARLQR